MEKQISRQAVSCIRGFKQMIKFEKLPQNIEKLLDKGITYLKSRNDIVFAYLFGGLAKGNLHPLSDIDIAIYLRDDIHFSSTKMKILEDLIDILNTGEIDLVVLNVAPLSLKMRILQNKKVIVDNDPFLRHRFESLTMRQSFDFSFSELQILDRRFMSGR